MAQKSLALGLGMALMAHAPAAAYEYGWIVTGGGPGEPEAQPWAAERRSSTSVWSAIAGASSYHPGAGSGVWAQLLGRSLRREADVQGSEISDGEPGSDARPAAGSSGGVPGADAIETTQPQP